MEKKTPSSRINSYLVSFPKHLGDILRLVVALSLFGQAACTGGSTTINQTNPPASQASGNTRTSDPDGWGGGGTGDGGGGQGVQCSNEVKDASLRNRLIIRDVYEAQYNYKRTMVSSALGAAGTETVDDKSIDFLLAALRRYYGLEMVSAEFGKAEFWKAFIGKISFLSNDERLYPSKDANSPIALPGGCKIVQVAYWDESGLNDDGILYVDRQSWKNLDQFNKVALLAHEYFFKLARTVGFKNSDYARYRVGQLLSTEGMPGLFVDFVASKIPETKGYLPESARGFKYCVGSSKDPENKLRFYQYQDSKGLQRLSFSEVKAARYTLPPLQSVSVVVEGKSAAETTDWWFQYGFKNFLGGAIGPSKGKYTGAIPFTTTIPSKEHSIKFNMLNPYSDPMGPLPDLLKSKEELIGLTINGLKTEIIALENMDQVTTDTQLVQAIAILNYEVDEAIKLGKYPTGFPLWTRAFKALYEGKVTKDGNSVAVSNERAETYLKVRPDLLYQLKLGTYDAKLVDKAFPSRRTYKDQALARPTYTKVSLEVDGRTIDFSLNCEDYLQVYKNLNARTNKADTQNLNPHLAVSINRPDLENPATGGGDPAKIWAAAKELELFKKMQSILQQGTLGRQGDRDNFIGDNYFDEKICNSEYPNFRAMCLDTAEFYYDLKYAKYAELQACPAGFGSKITNSTEWNTLCVAIVFPDTRQKYITEFTVRLQPQVKSNIPEDKNIAGDPNEEFGRLILGLNNPLNKTIFIDRQK